MKWRRAHVSALAADQQRVPGESASPARRSLMVTTVGGMLAAFFASLCCIGQVVLAMLGVGIGATGFLAGTAEFLKALLPYRPVFIGLTILLLGFSFYLVYRSPPSAVCASGKVCAPGAMSRSNRIVLWVLAVLALVLILAPYWLAL